MALFLEDSERVTKKRINIPLNAKKTFKAMEKLNEPYLDKVQGGHVLKRLARTTKDLDKDTITVDNAKVILHRQNQFAPNTLSYQLYGGQLGHNILKKGVEQARGVKTVDAVKPPKPTTDKSVKPVKLDTKIVTKENRVIKESFDEEHCYYDYLNEYDARYVFNEFLSNPNGKQDWGVLINPSMYQKALSEFTRYGKLTTFPTRYVYQWMGIIMRNTAILKANTAIAGHDRWFPDEEFEDFVNTYFKDGREINVAGHDEVKIEVFQDDVIKLANKEFNTLNEAVDKYGQTYFPWMSQYDVNRLTAQQELEREKAKFAETYGDIGEYIANFNQNSTYEGKIEADNKTNKLYWVVDSMNFLDLIGFYEWMSMPDGSDAFSDFGIEPLERVISEYNEQLPPEKVLVIVNKALDIYHQRGDMASIFITGGRGALSRIAEETKKGVKKVYITEKQILNLRKWQTQ